MKYSSSRTDRLAALRIVAIYTLFAALWILLSDNALSIFVRDTATLLHIAVLKGFLFIIVTGTLLYQLIVRHLYKARRIEENLRVSRNLINSLLEGTTDAIFVKDRQGRYLLFNSAAEKITGKAAADVIGNDDTFLFSDVEAGKIMAGDRRVMDAGLVMTYEDCLTAADGTYRTFLATKGPIFDAAGKISGLFGISRDITDHARAEEILQESEKRYRSLFENMLEGYAYCRMLFDDQGVPADFIYLDVNSSFTRLTGLTDVVDKKVTEVIPEIKNLCPELFEIYGRVALTGQSERFDINFEPLKIWLSISVYSSRQGYFVAVFDNITERKRAQEALQDATHRLQLAITSVRLGIWDRDIVNDTLVWDDRMFEIYGIDSGSFKSCFEAWNNCLHPDDVADELKVTQAAVDGEREYDTEFRIIRPEGTIKNIKANGIVIRDSKGEAIRMIGLNQDITDQKHMEEQLRQSQKMEAIGQLAGGVAHDFNNILTVIYGYCSLMQMNMEKNSPHRSSLDQVLVAAERAANLTRSLLAFSRKQTMSPKTVNLNDLILNVGKLLTRIIGEDIQFKTVFSANPLLIFADGGQIEQVLMNLAANARDAMQEGGLLAIETEVQDLQEDFIHAHGYGACGKYVVMTVSDTGKGMDAETSKKIFEPFFTTKEVGKGTGLGLSIVFGVIKQHNGYINVYSEEGKGTTFRIYLPLVSQQQAEHEQETIPDYPGKGTETVLVAEDDASIRELTDSILRKFGYNVIFASDGADAIEKFEANSDKIDIVVMDMVMPKKSGKEAYAEIRKLRPDVKVLFMSGYSPDLLHNKGILNNEEQILMKPLQPLDFVRKVRSMLDNKVKVT